LAETISRKQSPSANTAFSSPNIPDFRVSRNGSPSGERLAPALAPTGASSARDEGTAWRKGGTRFGGEAPPKRSARGARLRPRESTGSVFIWFQEAGIRTYVGPRRRGGICGNRASVLLEQDPQLPVAPGAVPRQRKCRPPRARTPGARCPVARQRPKPIGLLIQRLFAVGRRTYHKHDPSRPCGFFCPCSLSVTRCGPGRKWRRTRGTSAATPRPRRADQRRVPRAAARRCSGASINARIPLVYVALVLSLPAATEQGRTPSRSRIPRGLSPSISALTSTVVRSSVGCSRAVRAIIRSRSVSKILGDVFSRRPPSIPSGARSFVVARQRPSSSGTCPDLRRPSSGSPMKLPITRRNTTGWADVGHPGSQRSRPRHPGRATAHGDRADLRPRARRDPLRP